MKPKHKSVFCNDCQRTKILFDSEEEAQRFLKFNTDEILSESYKAPVRVYYCNLCGGWHTTSRENKNIGLTRGEQYASFVDKCVELDTLINSIEKEDDEFAAVRKIKESRLLFENLKRYRLTDPHLFCKVMRKLARVDSNFCETETLNDCIITFKAFVDKSDRVRYKNMGLCISMLEKAFEILNLMPSKGMDLTEYERFKGKILRRINNMQKRFGV